MAAVVKKGEELLVTCLHCSLLLFFFSVHVGIETASPSFLPHRLRARAYMFLSSAAPPQVEMGGGPVVNDGGLTHGISRCSHQQ